MKESKAFYLLAVVAAILIIGVAYAAINSITLNVTGTANAAPSDANFKVAFTGDVTKAVADGNGASQADRESKVTATAADGSTTATLNIESGALQSKGDKVTAVYTVDNASADLKATLAVSTSGTDSDYFKVETALGSTSLIPGASTTITVTVELIKNPVDAVSTNISVGVVASASEYTAE